MSYILDALKKSEEERERGEVPKLTTHLITEAGTKRRMWPWVVGVALFANAAVLGVFLLPSDEPPAGVRQESAAETPEAKPAEPAEPTESAESKTAAAQSPPAKPKAEAPAEAKPPPAKPEAETPAATTPSVEPATPAVELAAAESLPQVIFPPRQAAVPAPVKAAPRSEPPAPAPKETEVAAVTPTPEPAAPTMPEGPQPAPVKWAPEPEPTPPEPTPVVAAPKPEPPRPEKVEPPAPKKTVVAIAPPVKLLPKPMPAAPKPKRQAPKSVKPPVAVASLSVDASDSGYAVAYYNRGWGYAGKRLFDQAVADYTQAIRLNKEYADAYFARGWVYEKRDKIDLALKDYTRAIEIRPNHALAYNNRGVLQLHRSLYDEAAGDFATAFTLADKNLRPYVLLWLHLSRIRSGGDGKPELIEYAKKLDLRRWPGVVVSMFLGEASAETVIAGTKDKDSGKQKEKECVAFYFLGQQKLLEGDTAGAREFFRRTVETGVASYVQYGAAQKELRLLGAS